MENVDEIKNDNKSEVSQQSGVTFDGTRYNYEDKDGVKYYWSSELNKWEKCTSKLTKILKANLKCF